MPDIPTMREEGVAGYEFNPWFATYFPAKTPPDIVEKMRKILRAANTTKNFTESLTSYGNEPFDLAGNDLLEMNRKQIEEFRNLVKKPN